MAKKALLLIFTILSALTLVACGNSSSDDPPPAGLTPCTDCITFITTNSFDGDLQTAGGGANGIEGADNLCMDPANGYPGTGTYKALIVDGTNRVACTTNNCTGGGSTEHIDWVLHPDTNYYRSDGTTQIMTTNADGIHDFSVGDLINTFDAGSYWTGFSLVIGTQWTPHVNDCINWNSNNSGDRGHFGIGTTFPDSRSIGYGVSNCDLLIRLACVEQ